MSSFFMEKATIIRKIPEISPPSRKKSRKLAIHPKTWATTPLEYAALNVIILSQKTKRRFFI